MKKGKAILLRRLLAWAGCLLMLLGQFPLPAAGAMGMDLAQAPTVMLYFSTDGETTQPVAVVPSLSQEMVVYWGVLPEAAFQYPITMEILIPVDSPYAYLPAEPGAPVSPILATDFSIPAATISVVLDGQTVGSYPLYISSLPMPEPETEPEPEPEPIIARIGVVYQADGEDSPFYTEQAECAANDSVVISMRKDVVPDGYTLVGENSVQVFVDASGIPSLSTVMFMFEKEQQTEPELQNGYVYIYYTDMGGQEIAPAEYKELTPGNHNVSYSHVPEGYVPNPDWPASFEVKVGNDGTVDRDSIYFEFKVDDSGQETEPETGTEPEKPEEPTEPEQPQDETLVEIGRYGYTNKVVNFRPTTSTEGPKAFENVNSSTFVWVIGELSVNGVQWYKITYQSTDCYVVGEYLNVLSPEENDAYLLEQSSVKVTVQYVEASNVSNVLATQSVSCPKGAETLITADLSGLPGYSILGDDRTTVRVSEDGQATPDVVTFAVQKLADKGTITVRYVDNEGNVLANPQTIELAVGSHTVTPNASISPDYTLLPPASVDVTIDSAGAASPAEVVFTYQVPEKLPAKGSFVVRHTDDAGKDLLTPQTVEMEEGQHIITPGASPEGYTLREPQSVTVNIDGNGAASPAEVIFFYDEEVVAPVTGTVTIEYKDTLGAAIATAESRAVVEGDNEVYPDPTRIPEGYQLKAGEASVVNVTLGKDGTVAPAAVTFVYEAKAQKAAVTVQYTNAFGEPLVTRTEEFDKAGTYHISVDSALIPSGYELKSTTEKSVEVVVDKDFVATPSVVTFACDVPAQPAEVVINYVLKSDNTVLQTETRTLAPGTREMVSPKTLDGYSLAEGSTLYVEVVVSEKGVATPGAVTFYYKKTEPDQYEGYALTITKAALRHDASLEDSAITTTLVQDTLLYVKRQFDAGGVRWDEAQEVLGTNLKSGYVQDSQIKRITPAEADAIIKKYNEEHAPPEPDPWVAPPQVTGYYITLMTNVPLRKTTDVYAASYAWLPIDTVVYVSGQVFPEQETWHVSTYDGSTGYIRDGQLRKLTAQEEQTYKDSQKTIAPTTAHTPAPSNPQSLSSYGYVTSSSVNFRQTPNGTKIKTLNKYALTLIYGTKVVNGTTWYNVNQGGTIGWVHGDYLHVMTLAEFTSFINSNEYYQGLTNNGSTSGGSGSTGSGGSNTSGGTSNSSGSSSPGTVSSVEDWNVGAWQNTGTGLNASYEPFDPNATPIPTASGELDTDATVEPAETFVIGTMIPINYEEESRETQTGTAPWGLIAAGVVLVGGAGGVYAYALNQNNKRKAAAKAAAASRKTGAAGAAGAAVAGSKQNAQSPYARRAVAAPPVSGSTQQQGRGNPQSPYPQPGSAAGTQQGQSLFNAPGTGAGGQSLFGSPLGASQASGENPYARPMTGTSAESAGQGAGSPQSTAQGAAQSPAGQAAKNPYAQPVNRPAGEGESSAQASAAARRTSRTQRYQNTEGNDSDDA